MKLSAAAAVVLSTINGLIKDTVGACSPQPLDYHPVIKMQVEKVGMIPTVTNDAFAYNMAVADGFDSQGRLFFLEQAKGKIYMYKTEKKKIIKIWDMESDEFPQGLDLNKQGKSGIGAGQTYTVKAMTPGTTKNEVIIVFTSATLPKKWTKPDASLPAEGAVFGYMCAPPELELIRDMYRVGKHPSCIQSGQGMDGFSLYDVFYKFKIEKDKLVDPEPFFVLEGQNTPGHMGGGIASVGDGTILWGVGDCLIFGTDGRYAPQDNNEICGKILRIDTNSRGAYEIVAKGTRNPQQLKIIRNSSDSSGVRGLRRDPEQATTDNQDILVFIDIGGVTAEEVNAVKLDDILQTETIENFGWGRNITDGKAREGTCYVGPGIPGVLGTEPPAEANAPSPENGYQQPWIQFGRTETDFFFAISSFAISNKSFKKLKLVWTEFNTGLVMGTKKAFDFNVPQKSYKIQLYDDKNNYLENGFNDLVKQELGDVGYYRGDPRMFHYPDGTAGVFIERTGAFYKITEM